MWSPRRAVATHTGWQSLSGCSHDGDNAAAMMTIMMTEKLLSHILGTPF